MIKAVGYNKILLIVILGALLVATFLYNKEYLAPELLNQQRKLAAINSEISTMTNDLDQLRNQLSQFEKEKEDFASIQALGFFDSQNRVETKKLISQMQRESRLLTARYTVKPAQYISDDKTLEAGYKILKTDMNFKLEAIEDVDIYKFIYLLNYGFPGQLHINDFVISKEADITLPLIRKIGVGQSESIIGATLNITWQTMVPDETTANVNENNVGEVY